MLIVPVAGCAPDRQPASESDVRPNKLTVAVVNYPLAYFARRVGAELTDVVFPVPGHLDPSNWDPTGDSIAAFQSADLICLNGADYAKWTSRATLPGSRTVVTTRDVEDRFIQVPEAVTHRHGPGGEHSHAVVASETWLDPQLAIAQARVIQEELARLIPESADAFRANLKELAEDLQSLDQEFESVFVSSPLPWTASHPAFSYVGRRYSLGIKIEHWEPSRFPSDDQWQKLEERLSEQPSSWMLWEDEPAEQTRERLRSLGVEAVVFRLAARPPESGDYITVMRKNLASLREAISAQSSP